MSFEAAMYGGNFGQKLSSMKRVMCFLVFFLASAQTIFAQDMIILKQGQGGLAAGKDAWAGKENPGINYGNTPVKPEPVCDCDSTNCFMPHKISTRPLKTDTAPGAIPYPHNIYYYLCCNADYYFACIVQPWNDIATGH